ncbi:CMP-2-keto-3-deoxyoctulosonic acid synthetase [SAR116 cluster alpha proteobacterium HIMB100]|nr:CMP-2-keto-3-deoxyoctulosonic acid synthetase [SAR116 cluster alpha proteobacterium HIMB100]
MAADLGPVVVATDSEEIKAAIQSSGGEAVLTAADHPSGSDRIYEALCHIDEAGKYQAVINLQGDLPELDPQLLHHLARLLDNPAWDLTTLVAPATAEEAAKAQIVKAVVSFPDRDQTSGRALYFSRAAIPDGPAPCYHHIGLYGWRRPALAQFVALPPSPLEISEKLEQLRALEAGMHIGVAVVEDAPGGIDTAEDLAAARARLG